MRFTPDELAAATGGRLLRTGSQPIAGAFIDSRNPRPGALFVPIVAQRDGHDFLAAAIEGGASAVLILRGRPLPAGAITIVEVDDTLDGLTRLAMWARDRIAGPVVAITGSNGKTTTRALTAAAIGAQRWPVLSTKGNLNNHLGVPLTLLDEPHEPTAAVIELGMSALGENEHLARIVRPDVAIVTSIALEHLESMGTLEAIARAEAEVMPFVATGGAIVIPDDEPLLEAQLPARDDIAVLRFGTSTRADVRIADVRLDTRTHARLLLRDGTSVQVSLRNFGAHNARNAAAALAAAMHLGVDAHRAAKALAEVEVVGDRGRVIEAAGHLLIADCYNANPGSMQAALTSLASLRAHRPGPLVAVLGDMLELGPREDELHRDVGRLAGKLGIDVVIAVGPRSRNLAEAAREGGALTQHFDAAEPDVGPWLLEWMRGLVGVTVLFKASRGVALERVVQRVERGLGRTGPN